MGRDVPRLILNQIPFNLDSRIGVSPHSALGGDANEALGVDCDHITAATSPLERDGGWPTAATVRIPTRYSNPREIPSTRDNAREIPSTRDNPPREIPRAPTPVKSLRAPVKIPPILVLPRALAWWLARLARLVRCP